MTFQVVGSQEAPVVVVSPRQSTYGHQLLEFLMGLYLARALKGAAVFSFEHGPPVCPPVFALECAEVPVLRGREAKRAVAAAGRARSLQVWRDWPVRQRQMLERRVYESLDALSARWQKARSWRKQYKAYLGRRASVVPAAGPPDFYGLDFRECYARHPLTFRLPSDMADQASSDALAAGVDLDARLATLHVRESGFKSGLGGESPADAIRNARIDDYRLACDRLASAGFTIVRVGDPSMSRFRYEAVVDLATSPRRTALLELAALLRSRLFVATDSGPYVTSYLSGVPCLAANVTNVLGGYPVHSFDRYLLKHPVERSTGHRLSLREMLTADYFATRKNLERYAFEDNTPDELVDGVDEMLSLLDGPVPPTPAQDAFHGLAVEAYHAPAVVTSRTRKGEPARQVLGDGRVGRAFAARHLDRG